MMHNVGSALRSALTQGLIRDEDTAVIFYDLSFLEARIRYLTSSFPPETLHGLAVKANPLTRIMEFAARLAPNIGVEAASIGEVTMALHTGYRPDQVIFDSPVKTISDLIFAISRGIHLNIDNLSELERVNQLILAGSLTPVGLVGIRINPQIGVGTILESSVAGAYSKFGVPINIYHTELEQAFLTCPWLTGVHLHVGSQGCSMQMLTDGIGVLYDFVLGMNEKRSKIGMTPISVFDIGGGLPISYHSEIPPPSMQEYVSKIAMRAPQLFHPASFKLMTEFGRWVYTNAGYTISRVEYVKREPAINTAMLHVGAGLFVREGLNPRDWHHEYSVFDRHGNLKSGQDDFAYNLAGPLCFSGDIIAKNVLLPRIEEGDYLVIHDTGGYTFSMWSRYNSRQTPRILGYHGDCFEILKERESLEELQRFWE
ncbi:MAG: diaminopimelate decarboxylase [Bacteroidetes bacterium]|nr:diaminopimelate decarboxylase [Bacteroidota bacterium]